MSDPDADYRWLVARERGEDVGHVLATERAPYEQLGELLGSGVAPSAGFQQRVLDAIDAAEAAERGEPPVAAAPAPAVGSPAPAAVDPIAAAPAQVAVEPIAVAPAAAAVEPSAIAPEAQRGPVAAAEPAAKPEPAGEVVPIRPREPRPRPRPWIWAAGGVLAAAAALLLVLGIPRLPHGSSGPQQIAFATEVRHGATVLRGPSERGDQASVGDTLVVRAIAPGPAELRVYGGSNGRLIASCNEQGGCTVERDGEVRRFVLEVALDVPGTVSAVVFVGTNLPPSTRSLDPDLEAAAAARIEVKQDRPVRVL